MKSPSVLVLATLIGIGGALASDLDAWQKARAEKGRRVRFDWPLCIVRCVRGGLVGLMGGLGFNVAAGS